MLSARVDVDLIIIFSEHTGALLYEIAFSYSIQARRQSVLLSLPPPAIFVVVKRADSDSDRVSRPARLLPATSGVGRGPPYLQYVSSTRTYTVLLVIVNYYG